MMLTQRTAVIIFVIGLASIASSQLMVKWRFGVIGPSLPAGVDAFDIARAVIADKWLWVAAALIGTGLVTWYAALTRLPLTFMFPVAGIVSPVVATGAHLLLGEPLSLGQMGAILMIAVGVALLGFLQ
jgi:drug/metabolite transporter (DMT)-like permease